MALHSLNCIYCSYRHPTGAPHLVTYRPCSLLTATWKQKLKSQACPRSLASSAKLSNFHTSPGFGNKRKICSCVTCISIREQEAWGKAALQNSDCEAKGYSKSSVMNRFFTQNVAALQHPTDRCHHILVHGRKLHTWCYVKHHCQLIWPRAVFVFLLSLHNKKIYKTKS